MKEFKVRVKSGLGEYWKDLDSIYINKITLSEMENQIESLKAENAELKAQFEKFKEETKKTNALLIQNIELMSKKIIRLEKED